MTANKSRRSAEALQWRSNRGKQRKASRPGKPSSRDDSRKWHDGKSQWQNGDHRSYSQQADNDLQKSKSDYSDAYQRSHGHAKNPARRANENYESTTARVATEIDTTRRKVKADPHVMNRLRRWVPKTNNVSEKASAEEPTDADSDPCTLGAFVPSVVPPAANLVGITHADFFL